MITDTIVFYEHDEYVFAMEKLREAGIELEDYGWQGGTYAAYITVPVVDVRDVRQVLDDYFIEYEMFRA